MEICECLIGKRGAGTAISDEGSRKNRVSAFQEYVELHQRYLVKGEDVLNEWHMEKIRRRTNSRNLHGPYVDPPDKQKVGLPSPVFLLCTMAPLGAMFGTSARILLGRLFSNIDTIQVSG